MSTNNVVSNLQLSSNKRGSQEKYSVQHLFSYYKLGGAAESDECGVPSGQMNVCPSSATVIRKIEQQQKLANNRIGRNEERPDFEK